MPQLFHQCPVCGGAIHPIAGRCKHCKTDLVKLREQAERAARAARMNAPAAMPEGRQGPPLQAPAPQQAPPPNGHPADAPTPAPTSAAPSAPVALPPMYSAPPRSEWSRRWPLAVGAVALLAIGLSVGIMVERSGSSETDTGLKKAGPSKTPHMVPDRMPKQRVPRAQPKGGAGPHSALPPPGWGAPSPSAPHAPSAKPGDAPEVGLFAVALTETVCEKLDDCGLLDEFSKVLCHELAQQVRNPEAEARVRRGECHYDRAAAAACLDTVRGLSCTAQPADVMDWVAQAGSLADCTSAYVCN